VFHIISLVVQETHTHTSRRSWKPSCLHTLHKGPQRKEITNRYMGILVSSASLASCLPRRRSKRRKERRRKTNGPESGVAPSLIHSFMDLGSGSPKTKPSTLWRIGRDDAPKPTPDSGSAATARRRRWGKADPPAIFLKPSMNPADLQPPPTPPEGERREQLLNNLTTSTTALERTLSRRWSRRTKIHRKASATAAPARLGRPSAQIHRR
jgi:hypothetical protein